MTKTPTPIPVERRRCRLSLLDSFPSSSPWLGDTSTTITNMMGASASRKRPHESLFRSRPRMWMPHHPVVVSSEDDVSEDSDASYWSSSSDDDDEDENGSHDECYSKHTGKRPRTTSTGTTKRRVRFASRPVIREIPSHKCYSKQDKEEIWNSRSILKKMVRRNRRELAWEMRHGGDVVTEEDFYENPEGHQVHPAHVQSCC